MRCCLWGTVGLRTLQTLAKSVPRVRLTPRTFISETSMNALLARYRELAELHGKHTVAGDAKKTNRTFDELHSVLVDMVVEESDILLFSLYEDDDRFVQLWSSAHTLELDESRAKRKLKELLDADIPIVSMSARYTISGWNEGGLRVRA